MATGNHTMKSTIALHASTRDQAILMGERIEQVCFDINGDDYFTVGTDLGRHYLVIWTSNPAVMVQDLIEEGFL